MWWMLDTGKKRAAVMNPGSDRVKTLNVLVL